MHLLEIGVAHGGSLQMWKRYFGERACIFGVDIDPYCKNFEEEQIKVFIGNQAKKTFLRQLTEKIPRIDILVDDGGHGMKQQINTFEVLYPQIAPDGIYLCEDIHTSYWKSYGAGHRKPGTFVEYSKNFIDYIHAWHSQEVAKPNV